jgi:hypothetical protein
MLGWKHGRIRITIVALTAAALSGLGCADRRRGGESSLRRAEAAPAAAAAEPRALPATRVVTCGQPGAPECPLQAWMDNRLNVALSGGDYPEVARAMRELGSDRPEAFPTWTSWTEQGVAAAERNDEEGLRKVCSGCHDDTRADYRRTMRDRPVPGSQGAADKPARPRTTGPESLSGGHLGSDLDGEPERP